MAQTLGSLPNSLAFSENNVRLLLNSEGTPAKIRTGKRFLYVCYLVLWLWHPSHCYKHKVMLILWL